MFNQLQHLMSNSIGSPNTNAILNENKSIVKHRLFSAKIYKRFISI